MKIRAMQNKDRESVLQLLHETDMFTAEEEQVASELIDTYLYVPQQEDYLIDVVEEEEAAAAKIMGYSCYGPTPLTDATVDLYWIAVRPSHHHKGYGKALVNHMETAIRKRGGRLIIIETSSLDKYAPTRQFYLRLGYEESARIRDYYKPGDHRVIYCKYFQPEGA